VPQKPTRLANAGPDQTEPAELRSRRCGKTQAMLEHAAVCADKLLAAGVLNPVVVYAGKGRAGDLRRRLDEMGAKTVRVLETDA